MKKIKEWRPIILSSAFLLGIAVMMLTILHHYQVVDILNKNTGYYIERHIFLDKIYIGSDQHIEKKLKITSVKKNENSFIIQTNSKEGFYSMKLNYVPQVEYKMTSKYLHIPSNKKVIVLDSFGSEMEEFK